MVMKKETNVVKIAPTSRMILYAKRLLLLAAPRRPKFSSSIFIFIIFNISLWLSLICWCSLICSIIIFVCMMWPRSELQNRPYWYLSHLFMHLYRWLNICVLTLILDFIRVLRHPSDFIIFVLDKILPNNISTYMKYSILATLIITAFC